MAKQQDYMKYPREVFASLPMKERFVLNQIELEEELTFRHKLYKTLRGITFKECNLFIKKKSCCIRYSTILELLIALNKSNFVAKLCDNNPDIRKCWQGLPEVSVEISIKQRQQELPKKIKAMIDKINLQEKHHGENRKNQNYLKIL